MSEIWKEIDGYEGLYLISNCGNVKSLEKEVSNQHNKYIKPERILRPIMVGNYLGVQLSNNGTKINHYIHRLVASTFIENPYNKKEVNHIDGNRFNNNAINLEWSTRKENEKHAHETGLKNSLGENNPMCKFSNETVREIRTLYSEGNYKQSELASMFSMSRMQVNRIVRNLLRKDVI